MEETRPKQKLKREGRMKEEKVYPNLKSLMITRASRP